MKNTFKNIFVLIALAGLWSMDFSPEIPFVPVFMADAEAVVGRPLTPVSVGGVARRTTRRAVVYSSSSSAAAAQQQQAAPAPAPAAPALAAGTVVSALPDGCVSSKVDGVDLFNCGGVYYQPTFQSNNLVYVVK